MPGDTRPRRVLKALNAVDGMVYSLVFEGSLAKLTVGALKRYLQDTTGLATNLQVLEYQGVVLQDERTCGFYGIEDESMLHLDAAGAASPGVVPPAGVQPPQLPPMGAAVAPPLSESVYPGGNDVSAPPPPPRDAHLPPRHGGAQYMRDSQAFAAEAPRHTSPQRPVSLPRDGGAVGGDVDYELMRLRDLERSLREREAALMHEEASVSREQRRLQQEQERLTHELRMVLRPDPAAAAAAAVPPRAAYGAPSGHAHAAAPHVAAAEKLKSITPNRSHSAANAKGLTVADLMWHNSQNGGGGAGVPPGPGAAAPHASGQYAQAQFLATPLGHGLYDDDDDAITVEEIPRPADLAHKSIPRQYDIGLHIGAPSVGAPSEHGFPPRGLYSAQRTPAASPGPSHQSRSGTCRTNLTYSDREFELESQYRSKLAHFDQQRMSNRQHFESMTKLLREKEEQVAQLEDEVHIETEFTQQKRLIVDMLKAQVKHQQ